MIFKSFNQEITYISDQNEKANQVWPLLRAQLEARVMCIGQGLLYGVCKSILLFKWLNQDNAYIYDGIEEANQIWQIPWAQIQVSVMCTGV
jgi:hypothetical protein